MNYIFRNGKLNPAITAPSQLIQLCMEAVEKRQRSLLKKYELEQLQAYRIDQGQGRLRVFRPDDSYQDFDVAPVGFWNAKEKQWLWAWGSSGQLGPVLLSRGAALKGLGDCISAPDFEQAQFPCDAQRSQIFSTLATEYLGGLGRFVAPNGDLRLHLVLLKASPAEESAALDKADEFGYNGERE